MAPDQSNLVSGNLKAVWQDQLRIHKNQRVLSAIYLFERTKIQ